MVWIALRRIAVILWRWLKVVLRICWRIIWFFLKPALRWFQKKPLRIAWGAILMFIFVPLMCAKSVQESNAAINSMLPAILPLTLLLAGLQFFNVFGRFGGKK